MATAPDPSLVYSRSYLSYALTKPILGTAGAFAILGGRSVANAGLSTSDGDVGVWPGATISGRADLSVLGHTVHEGTVDAEQAQSDVAIAYDALAGLASGADLTGRDLGGLTLAQGVYSFSSSARLTGTLVLDAQGDDAAIWIFQVATALDAASDATVRVINGGQDCAVFWQVGGSATLGTRTTFKGSILALESISLAAGATLNGGRALARTGAVTLDGNEVSAMACTDVGPSQTGD